MAQFTIIKNALQKKKNKSKCDKKSVYKNYIEEIVLSATQEFMQHTNIKNISKVLADTYNKSIEKDTILESLNKELQDDNKKLKNILTALENGIFNDTTNDRMIELEIRIKEIKEKIASRQMLTIKPLSVELVYEYLKSFKDLDYSLENAKQRLIDMFVNRVVLYDDHCEIYFNITSDKSKQLKLSEKPDISQEIEYIENKKEQSNPKGSDCSQLAGKVHPQTNKLAESFRSECPCRLRRRAAIGLLPYARTGTAYLRD